MMDFISCEREQVSMQRSEAEVNKYNRNQKEDVKLAVDYIFELREKLINLHPNAQAIAIRMLRMGYAD